MSLHGAPDGREGHDSDDLVQKRSAIVVNLNEQVMRDLQQCCQNGKVLQLLGGKSAVCPWIALQLSFEPF